ncbi:RNA-guided endonuclease InsQ/TnpB family protein [Clostridioides sp. GD02377]|uniref:RNA-guided endonuclease InsQ/TnpB family protein n=1 Tax=unclassified Clostridioides TaxID=2635829 RepID=UPI0038A29E76
MILSKKVRLCPSELQEQKLWQSVGTARFIYNWTLAKQEENYKNGGKFISDNELRKEITKLKKSELSWLKEVSNNVSKQSIKDGCDAYKRFFKGLSDKPRFKSRRKSKKSFYNDNCKLKVKEDKLVNIEKVGWIKTNEQLPIGVKYSNPRISYDNKYWYISVGIEQEEIKEELTDISLGIDLGLKDLAICSDGTIYKNINKTYVVRKIEKRLKKLQKQVSRKYEQNKKGKEFVKTKNIIKLEKQIQQVHRRLTNIRNNYLHQTTTNIVKTKPYRVVIEDLAVSNMMKNKHLSKAISKQGFYEFRRQLEYKCKLRGIELVVVDRFYPSSKTCSQCGEIKKDLKLKDRLYKCECGLTIDRDLNASINLSKYKSNRQRGCLN